MKKRFRLFGKELAVQGLVWHRPYFFSKYNDGYTAFIDIGPVRFYRHFWREKGFNFEKAA